MPRLPIAAAVALSLAWAVPANAQGRKELAGRYAMEADPEEVMELRADGTASMGGEEATWSVSGNLLTLGPDTVPFQKVGDRLVLTMGAVQLAWKKLGGVAKAPSPLSKAAGKAQAAGAAAAPPADPPQAGTPQDVQLRELLLSSAWCSFTYNQVSGTSTTRRVVFRRDGTMLTGGGAETYSSGYGGTYAGQSQSSGAARWKVANLRLLVDAGDGAGFQDTQLSGTRNSNGAPILTAGGREYAQCP